MKKGPTVLITQSNYIPWKGYFDAIKMADIFVMYDNVQYTRRDWRNRNRIKTPNGPQWLSIPVEVKGKYHQLVNQVKVVSPDWKDRHWKTLSHVYKKAPYFAQYEAHFQKLYETCTSPYLYQINRHFIEAIMEILGCKTRLIPSTDFSLPFDKNERLVTICKELGATRYLSGPRAKGYLKPEMFEREGIEVKWIDYSGYPDYPQLYDEMVHDVTILDLIFHTGPDAVKYMKAFGKSVAPEENLLGLQDLTGLK